MPVFVTFRKAIQAGGLGFQTRTAFLRGSLSRINFFFVNCFPHVVVITFETEIRRSVHWQKTIVHCSGVFTLIHSDDRVALGSFHDEEVVRPSNFFRRFWMVRFWIRSVLRTEGDCMMVVKRRTTSAGGTAMEEARSTAMRSVRFFFARGRTEYFKPKERIFVSLLISSSGHIFLTHNAFKILSYVGNFCKFSD